MLVPLVLADLRVQLAHHRLRTLQGLDELVVGDQQRSGDAQRLVRRAGRAEDLAQLVLALGGPDPAVAAIDQPEDRSRVARGRLGHRSALPMFARYDMVPGSRDPTDDQASFR